MVLNQKKGYVLWLIWQNPKTRQRYHVGTLSKEGDTYFFEYELGKKRRGVHEALADGYSPHLAFPDLQRRYHSSHLFSAFSRRIPDQRRPDYEKIAKRYGLSSDHTELDLLRATGGRLATDTYEFVQPVYQIDDVFFLDFFVAGLRHYAGEEVLQTISPDQPIQLELEPENPKDSHAIKILYGERKIHLGYVPAFYSEFLSKMMRKGTPISAVVEQVNHQEVPQLKIAIKLSGKYIDFPTREMIEEYI